jgi:hypothetical protein
VLQDVPSRGLPKVSPAASDTVRFMVVAFGCAVGLTVSEDTPDESNRPKMLLLWTNLPGHPHLEEKERRSFRMRGDRSPL